VQLLTRGPNLPKSNEAVVCSTLDVNTQRKDVESTRLTFNRRSLPSRAALNTTFRYSIMTVFTTLLGRFEASRQRLVDYHAALPVDNIG